ncbi:MAG: SCO family protein [Candidatus Dormibacteraeota bacterium]|nr:SCO family protein [Candidatus Dormibacteraeota bacterium]
MTLSGSRRHVPIAVAAAVALVVGLGATLGVNALLSRSAPRPSTTPVSAQYLPSLVRQSEPAPDFTLPDQAGTEISLSALRGKTVLMTFMDPQCTNLCPIVGQEIAKVEAALPATVVPVLLIVSVAPDRSAADVRTFTSHVTWRPGWHWLLGDQAQLQAVWVTYHISVQPSPTDVAHDETLYVIDAQGRIAAGYNAPLPTAEVASTITKSSR